MLFIRPVKMDIGYWIPDIRTRKNRIIGYPKSNFLGIGLGSDSKNFGLSGIGLPDRISGIPELSDFLKKLKNYVFIINKYN